MHHALLNASGRNIAGEYRDAPVWIRGNSPHTAEFVPPHHSRQLAADIRATEADFASRVGDAPSSVRRVLELLPREPAVTADMVAEHAGISTATAYRAVERREAAGILAPAGKIRGTSVCVAPDIIAALDAFAERTGRRTRH